MAVLAAYGGAKVGGAIQTTASRSVSVALLALLGATLIGCSKSDSPASEVSRSASPLEAAKAAALAGGPAAELVLAKNLDAGLGLPVDHREAQVWFQKAADAGNTEAMSCVRRAITCAEANAISLAWIIRAHHKENADRCRFV